MLNLQNISVKANNSFQTVCPFPVGFVYSSMNSTSPASTFGGTWTAITGKFPYFNAGTSTGGSTTHQHNTTALRALVDVGGGSIGVKHIGTSELWTTNRHTLGTSEGSAWQTGWGAQVVGLTDGGGHFLPIRRSTPGIGRRKSPLGGGLACL